MGGSETEAETEEKQRKKTERVIMYGSVAETSEQEQSNIPRLSLLNTPLKMMHSPERSGMKTPPFFYSSSASVPFGWEEEPGKPRPCCNSLVSFTNQKCLELPPRLLLLNDDDDDDVSTKIRKLRSKVQSLNTVLEGPHVCSKSQQSPSFRILSKEIWIKDKVWFGSWRRKKDLKVRREVSEGNDFISYSFADRDTNDVHVDVTGDSHKNVRITKIKHSGSFYNMFNAKLWSKINGGLKQVVPWRSQSMKKNGFGGLRV